MAWIFWVGFFAFVLGMLILDISMFHKKAHEVSLKEAGFWTSFWVCVALLFSVLVYFIYEYDWLGMGIGLSGLEATGQYLTGWLVEESLSLDNVFVFALIFSYFNIPRHLQHRVLFWGVIGALVLRGVMIGAGVALINRFEMVQYFFALLLLYAALRMLFFKEGDFDPKKNLLFRIARRVYPMHHSLEGERFFITRPDGSRAATPLFLALLIIESSDVVFALDSVPAVFGITRDPFLVFTSNIFAILGLRSLYFVLAAVMARFSLLKYGLVLVLLFVAVKMLIEKYYHISTGVSLLVVVGLLAGGILASIVVKKKP